MADIELPDEVADFVEDARARVEVLVENTRIQIEEHARTLGTEVGERLTELGGVIQASLIALALAMVTAMLFAFAVAATLMEIGLPLYGALWIVTGVAIATIAVLVQRARRGGRRLVAPWVRDRA